MSVINTNITSLIAQGNLSRSQSALQTSMERLSSGLRINSAKDDAAGQAIANRMTAQITGLAQAQRNANDGISVAQTAEGGLNQINDNLQRIRELTVQAANGSNSSNDLQSIQDEVNQRLAEINRISEETDFNGTRVLSEATKPLTIQVGSQDNQTITVKLSTINAESLNLSDFNVNGQVKNEVAKASDLQIAGYELQGGNYVGSENLIATDNTIDALVKSGDLVELTATPGSFTAETVNATANANDVLNTFDDAGANEVVVDGVTYSQTGGQWSGTSEAFADDNAAWLDVKSQFDFDAQDRYEITIDNDSSTATAVWVDASGNLYENETGSDRIRIEDDAEIGGTSGPTDASITSILGNDEGSVTFGDFTYNTDSSGAITRTENVTQSEVVNRINSESATVTATIGSNAYEIAADGSVELDGGAVYVNDTGVLGIDDGGAATGEPIYVVDGTSVTEDGKQVYVDASESGAASLTQDDGGVRTYFEIKDDQGNTLGWNTRQDGSGDFAYVDSDGYTRDATGIDENAKTDDPLAQLDSALNQIDSLRSELGAVQNRFEDAINNLSTNETNLSAARSRIEDADYAMEVANMTRAQILQQAGTSVLAQANQIPQIALSLLG